ncbi:MAG: hypothetical protein LH473_10330 [Chitinophagales bacterium]|nr:hypothetical protein [Chitinophagales bacterium]
MKTITLSFFLLSIIFSASAQEAKHTDHAFKGYNTFITTDNPYGNTSCYNNINFQIGAPALAISFLHGKGNYHQIELCDLALNINNQNYFIAKTSAFTIGCRYSYNILIFKTRNEKLKTFIAPSAHLLANYNSVKFSTPISYPSRYTYLYGELEIAPVISYSFSKHFSIEANIPFTLIGYTTYIKHQLDPNIPAGDEWSSQSSPYLGPQYFQGRIGVVINL